MITHQFGPDASVIIADEAKRAASPIVYAHGWRTDAARDLFDRGVRAAIAEPLGQRAEPVALVSRVPGQERTDFGRWHTCRTYSAVFSGAPMIAHSGAYRLVADLIDDGCAPPVLILLDGLYGQTDAFRRYVEAGGIMVNVVSTGSESVRAATDRLQDLLGIEAEADVVTSNYALKLTDTPHGDPAQLIADGLEALASLVRFRREF